MADRSEGDPSKPFKRGEPLPVIARCGIPMTKGERADLERLINQRERVLKQQAQSRSAEVLAEFER